MIFKWYPNGGTQSKIIRVNNNVWYGDPPGGDKDVGTDDVTWADESVKYLDYLVHGEKYYGLIAFSQGVPMSMVYLAKTSNIFEKVILFNGYLPTTHRGLMDVIDMSFSTKTLSVLASNDTSFYDIGLDLSSGYFTDFQQVVSSTAGHNIPDLTDPIYQTVIDFMNYTEPFRKHKSKSSNHPCHNDHAYPMTCISWKQTDNSAPRRAEKEKLGREDCPGVILKQKKWGGVGTRKITEVPTGGGKEDSCRGG